MTDLENPDNNEERKNLIEGDASVIWVTEKLKRSMDSDHLAF